MKHEEITGLTRLLATSHHLRKAVAMDSNEWLRTVQDLTTNFPHAAWKPDGSTDGVASGIVLFSTPVTAHGATLRLAKLFDPRQPRFTVEGGRMPENSAAGTPMRKLGSFDSLSAALRFMTTASRVDCLDAAEMAYLTVPEPAGAAEEAAWDALDAEVSGLIENPRSWELYLPDPEAPGGKVSVQMVVWRLEDKLQEFLWIEQEHQEAPGSADRLLATYVGKMRDAYASPWDREVFGVAVTETFGGIVGEAARLSQKTSAGPRP